jgi:hypothetical protein
LNPRTIEETLAEIRSIRTDEAYSSMQAARNYYDSGSLPKLLKEHFFSEKFLNISQSARLLGVSSGTLKRILEGKDISENMLLRVENYFQKCLLSSVIDERRVEDVLRRPWRIVHDENTHALIANLSGSIERLVVLLRESNSLSDNEKVISRIQKQQLIALLEATIIELKAPAIDAKKASRLFGWIKTILRRGVERGIESSVSGAMKSTFEDGVSLVGALAKEVGVEHLDKLP